MTTVTRRRMSAQLRRDQILDVTRQVVESEGFNAVSIDRIALDCGITRTLIYQQFGTLPALLVTMVDREFHTAADGFLRAVQKQPFSEQERFTSALAGVLDAVDSAPATWRMFLLPPEGGPPELYERLAGARAITREYLNAALEAAGQVAGSDRELTIRMMHAMADELVRLRLQDRKNYTKERLLAQAEWMSKMLFQRS
ncbi:MAG: TetR/AcrR family transcriptional regulator [bacterium]|nr:TetR/AcrR family transcriptional regulator [bacterium]